MSIWQVLGISPTGDMAIIKQAYAEKAKLFHPEEHPNEFRALHDAYRQATRYARQHPQRADAPAAKPKPPQPPVRRPSYLPRDAFDNPRRSHLYLCPNDVFTPEQFHAIRRENKRFQASAHVPAPPPTLRQELSRLHIRGAAQSAQPADGLRFDAALHETPAQVPLPAAVTAAPAVAPPIQKTRQHPRALAGGMLVLWVIFLLTFGILLPPLITGPLYVALLAHQTARGVVRRSWLLTLAATLVDIVSVLVFMVLIEIYPAPVVASLQVILAIALFLLPLLRIIHRVSWRKT